MIDEDRTMQLFGYISTDARYRDNIVVVCDVCGAYRVVVNGGHKSELCRSCAQIGKTHTDETKRKLSELGNGKHHTDETKHRMSEMRKNPSDEFRRKVSSGHQGIPYEDWTEFISDKKYCVMFNEHVKENIRYKYGYRCFICNKPQYENIDKNNKIRKLSVHHVDKNKDQGCNGNKWRLVPVCARCHGMTHSNMWIARIEYLLDHVYINI